METASSTRPRLHALVLPLPAQGHINPMLNFSLHLASRGFIITFLNTEKAQNRMRCPAPMDAADAAGLQVRFVTIPGGYQEPPAPGHVGHDMQKLMELLDEIAAQQGTIEDIVVTSQDSSYPISCIISDSFFPWTQSLANKLGIKRVIFWTTSGMSLASTLEMRSGKFVLPTDNVSGDDVDDTTGGVTFKRSEFLAAIPFRRPEQLNEFKARLNGCEHAASIVVNTFKELEASSLEASICETHVHYVGPILPPQSAKNVTSLANLYQEESSCLDWLDKQQDGTVLYISFGSLFYLSQYQLEELAAGLEESKQPFLWVIRDGGPGLPEGFTERASYGLVIRWAPQTEVLGHVAVGGFLTHCGWNSAIESIHMGVPMLCYPLFGDQPINALLITKRWKLGVAMQKGEGGVVRRDVVHKAVLEVMHSEEIQERAGRMKVASEHAIQEGGSSYKALQNVILDLMEGA